MAAPVKDRALHVADGTWRADRHGGRVDAGGVAGVECDALLWDALEHWQAVFLQARSEVMELGATVVSAGEQVVPNPAHKVMKEASAEMRALAAILGIGPLNRSRLGVAAGESSDDADDIGVRNTRA